MRRVLFTSFVRDYVEFLFVRREVGISLGSVINKGKVETGRIRESGGVELAAADDECLIVTRRICCGEKCIGEPINGNCSFCLVSSLACHDDIGPPGKWAELQGERLPGFAPHNDRMSARELLKPPHIVREPPEELPAPPQFPVLTEGGYERNAPCSFISVNIFTFLHVPYTSRMSVIGIHEVVRRIKENDLITGLAGRDLSSPEGTGIDLRLGAVHTIIEGGAYIEADGPAGLGKRSGVKTEELYRLKDGDVQDELIVKPGEYYLVQTAETLHTPLDVMPMVYPRSSLFRAGLLLLATKTDPGYEGQLTFGLTNLGPFPVKLQLGARICNVVFHAIEGDAIGYRGQHQGGRVSHGEETQV